jgi:hypothetical protein
MVPTAPAATLGPGRRNTREYRSLPLSLVRPKVRKDSDPAHSGRSVSADYGSR